MWTFSWFAVVGCSIYSLHCPPGRWESALDALVWAGSTLWAASVYAGIRFGPADRTTQISIIWAGLVTAAIYFWWQPLVLGSCIAATLLIASASILKSDLRRPALWSWLLFRPGRRSGFSHSRPARSTGVARSSAAHTHLGRGRCAPTSLVDVGVSPHDRPIISGSYFNMVAVAQLAHAEPKTQIGS